MEINNATRRDFCIGIATVSATAAYTSPFFTNVVAQTVVPKRKNIDSLTPAEINEYAAAIRETMRRSGVDRNDKTGYDFHAELHNKSRNHPDSTSGACEHNSEEFLPWHRAHLAGFEKVLREINANVTIPYWDWTKTPTGSRFPRAFEDSNSPLHHLSRYPLSPQTPPIRWDENKIKDLIQEQDWSLFAGSAKNNSPGPGGLEFRSHNRIHSAIGPTMGNPFTAAEDPIYWSFHAYHDLVWSRWQKRHKQAYQDGDKVLWLEPASYKVKDMTDTKNLGPGLSYEYEYDFTIDRPPQPIVTAGDVRRRKLNFDFREGRQILAAPAESFAPARRTLLRMQGVKSFTDLTYKVSVYIHPKSVVISPGGSNERQYLVDEVTMWRSHHGIGALHGTQHQESTIYVDLTEAIAKYPEDGWTMTVLGVSVPNVLPGSANYRAQKSNEDGRIAPLSKVLDKLDIEER